MRLKYLVCWFVFLALFNWVPVSSAQTAATGALTGIVTDPSGAVIPNVKVVATSVDTSQVRTVTTAGDGAYNFNLLPPGNYRIRFEATGFQPLEVPSVTVTVTETGTLNQTLPVGSQTQAVTVQADVETVQTATSAIGTVIGAQSVTNLPLNTRNYVNLLSLSAGSATNVPNASTIGKGSAAINVNGAAAIQNNYLMDGVPVTNASSNAAAGESGTESFIAIPDPDSIAEFKIQTSTYDASFGRNPGANVNVVTKSGTNDFHGTGFEFFRNTVLNANDWFLNHADKPRGVLDQNQYGGVFGGPVKKDRVFFFLSFQHTGQRNGIASGGLSNPILPVIPTGDRTTVAWLDSMYTTYCGKKGAQGGVALACTPGGVGAQINPVALSLLQIKLANGNYYIPSGGTGTTGIPFSSPATYTEYQGMANMDYEINSKNTFAARYFYARDPRLLPFGAGTTALPGFPNLDSNTNETVVMKVTSILTDSLVNEASISYQRNIADSNNPATFSPGAVGQTPLTSYAPNLPLPTMTVGGFILGAYNFGIADIVTNQYQVGDQISWTHGKHTVRAGFQGAYYRRKFFYGSFEMGGMTLSSFPDFLIGLPGCSPAVPTCSTANPGGTPTNPATNGTAVSNISATGTTAAKSIPGGLQQYNPMRDMSVFFQDDFKVTRRLTLNLGLRWEYDGFPSEFNGRNTNMWPKLVALQQFPLVAAPCLNLVFPAPCPGATYSGYVVPSNYNVSTNGPLAPGVFVNNHTTAPEVTPPLDNFAPRIGFAWQPLSTDRFVVRGGFGYYYNRLPMENYYTPLARNPPYANNAALSGSALYFASLQDPWQPGPVGWLPRWYTTSGLSSNTNVNGLSPFMTTPLTYQYSLNTQYEFLKGWVLELGYVGSHGIHQFNGNSGSAGGTTPQNAGLLATTANPVNCGYDGVATDCITTDTTRNINLRVRYLGMAPSWSYGGTDESYLYNGLQATVRKQLTHGFTMQGTYTFSKALMTNWEGANNSFFPVAHVYTPTAGYRPQRLTVNYSWNLPSGHISGILGKVISGWTTSGVVVIQSGDPLTITDSRAGTIFGAAVLTPAQFAAGMGPANVKASGSLDSRVLGNFFNSTAFTPPPCLTTTGTLTANPGSCPTGTGTAYGDSGFGIVRGVSQNNWDLSLAKITRVGGLREDATLEFRTEFFNAFNHPQFTDPSVNVGSASSFGKITSLAVNPRLIQFALKYAF
jgi:Carboxypeptidase regulatory-like domain